MESLFEVTISWQKGKSQCLLEIAAKCPLPLWNGNIRKFKSLHTVFQFWVIQDSIDYDNACLRFVPEGAFVQEIADAHQKLYKIEKCVVQIARQLTAIALQKPIYPLAATIIGFFS